MNRRIEYNGYMIESTTRLKDEPHGWSLEVLITSEDPQAEDRRCRAPNTYPSKEVAVGHCLEFGRQIVDGKLQPRNKPSTS